MLRLAIKNIFYKPLSLTMSLILFALGSGLITVLLLLNKQLGDQFERNLAGVDLVIGAKGSPLQLILCNLYHIDAPTGNIALSESKAFLNPKHPLIKHSVPLSLGDNYKGYRIVGTTPGIFQLYAFQFAEGKIWSRDFEVVVGAGVAESLGLKLGDTFFSSHGFIEDDDLVHDYTEPFKIMGILAPTGSVLDNLILCNNETVWLVHAHDDHDDEDTEEGSIEEHHGTIQEDPPLILLDGPMEYDSATLARLHLNAVDRLLARPDQDITSLLVQFRGRNYQTLNMQRNINEQTNLQAATPAIEINRLYLLLGVGIDALRVLAFIIMGVSGLSIFVSLLNAMKERKYELALMRVMGASPVKLCSLILLEGIAIAILGYMIGALVGHGSIGLLSGYMQDAYRYALDPWELLVEEGLLLIACIVIGVLAAILPAIGAYRTDIASTLSGK